MCLGTHFTFAEVTSGSPHSLTNCNCFFLVCCRISLHRVRVMRLLHICSTDNAVGKQGTIHRGIGEYICSHGLKLCSRWLSVSSSSGDFCTKNGLWTVHLFKWTYQKLGFKKNLIQESCYEAVKVFLRSQINPSVFRFQGPIEAGSHCWFACVYKYIRILHSGKIRGLPTCLSNG